MLCGQAVGDGPLVLLGEGAGRWPISESVVGDLLELLEHLRRGAALDESAERVR